MDNGDAPATKRDLEVLKQELLETMAQQKEEILEGVQEMVWDVQTEILKAFLPFQETMNIQFRTLDVTSSTERQGLKARMEVLERRLAQIEKKLMLEPPPA